MDVANEILDAIEIIVDKKIRENTAQIYPGVCKSVSGNTCVVSINGKDNTVRFYGSTPSVDSIYRVFVPNGNMSMAFVITGGGSGGGSSPSGVTSYKKLTDLPSINGVTLQEGATSKSLSLYGSGNEPNYPVTKVNGKTGEVILTASDVGAAPAGYGIGEEYAARVNDTNLDTLKNGGTYYIGTGCTNTPPNTDSTWSTLHVIPGRACTQIYIPANDKNRPGTFTSWIARIYNDKTNAWGAWEWVNPPMALGIEYRTTERYQGSPVYYQRISYGTTLPASGFIQRVVRTLPIATTNILDIDVTVKNGTTYEVQKLPCISDSGVVLSVANAIQYNNYDNYCIRVRVFSDMSAWSIQKIVVKYTKTTD